MKTEKWLDVCLKNVIIFLGALVASGYETEAIWSALRHILNQTGLITRDQLLGMWVSLTDYKVIENTLADVLGHPWRLVGIGHHAPKESFGWSEALKKGLLKSFIRYITSARVAIYQIVAETKTFNNNKTFRFIVDKMNRCVLEVEYLFGPNGERRTAEEDYRSLLYYIRGILESLAPIWWLWEPKIGWVKYLTVNIRPEFIIRRENPKARVIIKDGYLFVDEEVYGQVVYLLRDRETQTYLGDYQEESGDGTIPAILITEDITTRCKQTDEALPILCEGEIYRYGEYELKNLIEMRWKSNWFFRMVESIPGILARIQDGIYSEIKFSQAQMLTAVEEEARRILQELQEESSPTKKVAQLLRDGKFPNPSRQLTVALLLDIVGYTKLDTDRHDEEVVELFQEFDRVGREQFSFWPYKSVGDAFWFIHSDWARADDEPAPYPTMEEAARGMISCALELLRVAQQRGFQLRIGVAFGYVRWRNQARHGRRAILFEGLGSTLNQTSRLQNFGCDPGQVAVSTELVELCVAKRITRPLREGMVIGSFKYRGEMPDKNGAVHQVWNVTADKP